MLELDVTSMVADADEMPMLSGSIAELGENASHITWRNSVDYGRSNPLLTPDQFDEVRDYYRDFGAWDDDEIDAWDASDLQGIVAQEAAAQIREMERFATYEEYQAAAERGSVSGSLYRGDDGRWFLMLSH